MISSDLKKLSKTVADPEKPMPLLKSKSALKSLMPEQALQEPVAGKVPSGRDDAGRGPVSVQAPAGQAAKSAGPGKRREASSAIRDERFIDYLSTSMAETGRTRKERAIQRNKALFMLALVLIVLFLVVYHMMR